MLAIHKKMLCTYYFLLIHDVNKRPLLAKFLLGDFSPLIQALFFFFLHSKFENKLQYLPNSGMNSHNRLHK